MTKIQSQLRIPLVLSNILPVGVMGAFLVVDAGRFNFNT